MQAVAVAGGALVVLLLRRNEYVEIDPAGREAGPPRVETGH